MQTTNESKRRTWRSHVEGVKSFSGSVEDYCRSKQITTQSFYYWRGKFTKESGSATVPSFVPVEVTRNHPSAATSLPDPRWLAELIHDLHSHGAR